MTGLLKDSANREAIDELNSLVQYYKELYLLLYEQANRQLLQSNFHSQTVSCNEISAYVRKRTEALQAREKRTIQLTCTDTDRSVRCDRNLLKILVDNILAANSSEMRQLKVDYVADGKVVHISFTFVGIRHSEEELKDLFSPSKDNFPYYIIRQIIREHDARYGHPGLRLDASRTEDGFTIHFTLTGNQN